MKKFYVTFGQAHVHFRDGKRLVDKDTVGVIEAESYECAYDRAFALFGWTFANLYHDLPDMTFYPKGLVDL